MLKKLMPKWTVGGAYGQPCIIKITYVVIVLPSRCYRIGAMVFFYEVFEIPNRNRLGNIQV